MSDDGVAGLLDIGKPTTSTTGGRRKTFTGLLQKSRSNLSDYTKTGLHTNSSSEVKVNIYFLFHNYYRMKINLE
jgi:hypothetical protein